jgi:hypothetical protein
VDGAKKEAVTPSLRAGPLSVPAAATVVAAAVIASVVAAIITVPESEGERY